MLGLTSLDLSREMISSLRMPKEVLYAMADCNPAAISAISTHLSGRILCITEFSSQLATLALSPKLTSPQFLEQAQALARRFEQIVPAAADLIAAAMAHTHEHLNALTRHGNFISPGVFSRLRANAKWSALPPGAAASIAAAKTTTDALPAAAVAPEVELGTVPAQAMDWAEQLAGSITFESQAEAPRWTRWR